MPKGAITSFQFILLIINFLIGSALVFSPTVVITEAKQDGWISYIVATIISFVIIFIITKLFKRYPGKSFSEICENILSKPLGKILNFLYMSFFLYLTSILLREIGNMITIAILPNTPFIAINIFVAIIVCYAAYKGISVVARFSEIFSVIAFIGFWLTILLVSPLIEFDRILPVLTEGFSGILKGSFLLLGFTYSEIITLFIILPYVRTQQGTLKLFFTGSIIASISLTIVTLTTILVLENQSIFLAYQSPVILARLINIDDFLTRIETLIIITYILTLLIKLLVAFFATLITASQIFVIKDYRNIILPFSLLVLSISVLFVQSSTEFGDFVATAWTPYALVFGLIIPVILLCISYIKKSAK